MLLARVCSFLLFLIELGLSYTSSKAPLFARPARHAIGNCGGAAVSADRNPLTPECGNPKNCLRREMRFLDSQRPSICHLLILYRTDQTYRITCKEEGWPTLGQALVQ